MAASFSQEEIADLRKVFQIFDTDGTGGIDARELQKAAKDLGLQFSYEDAREIIAELDKNHDGTIDFNEFLELMNQHVDQGDGDLHTELLQAFVVFDKDSSGTISPAELRHVLNLQGQKYTSDEITEMIAQVDLDGDGLINYEEFILLMTK